MLRKAKECYRTLGNAKECYGILRSIKECQGTLKILSKATRNTKESNKECLGTLRNPRKTKVYSGVFEKTCFVFKVRGF